MTTLGVIDYPDMLECDCLIPELRKEGSIATTSAIGCTGNLNWYVISISIHYVVV